MQFSSLLFMVRHQLPIVSMFIKFIHFLCIYAPAKLPIRVYVPPKYYSATVMQRANFVVSYHDRAVLILL